MKKINFICLLFMIFSISIKAKYSITIDKIVVNNNQYTNPQNPFTMPPDTQVNLTITYTVTKSDNSQALGNTIYLFFKKSPYPDYQHYSSASLPVMPTMAGQKVTSTFSTSAPNSYGLGYNLNTGELFVRLQYTQFSSGTPLITNTDSSTWRFSFGTPPAPLVPPKTGVDPRNTINYFGNTSSAGILGSGSGKIIEGNPSPYPESQYQWEYLKPSTGQWITVKKNAAGYDLATQNFPVDIPYAPGDRYTLRRVIFFHNVNISPLAIYSYSNQIEVYHVPLWSDNLKTEIPVDHKVAYQRVTKNN